MERLTEVHPGDAGRGGSADLTVEAGGAALHDLQDVQLAGEQGVPGGRDLQLGAGGQLLCETNHSRATQHNNVKDQPQPDKTTQQCQRPTTAKQNNVKKMMMLMILLPIRNE